MRNALALLVLLACLTLPAVSLAEKIELFFDGEKGPFVPERVGQRVRVEAKLLDSVIPLRICKVTFTRNWATLRLDDDGVRGTLEVRSLEGAGASLDSVAFGIHVELKVTGVSQSAKGPELFLRPDLVMFRLEARLRTAGGAASRPFPLIGNKEILPLRKEDVITWPAPPDSTVWFREKEIWVGMKAEPVPMDGNIAEVTCRPLLVAIRIRPRSGGPVRWIYLNVAPAACIHEGWENEEAWFRLPTFVGSEELYGKIREYFRSKGVPFKRIGG